jgi:hypothetical protein
MAVSEGRTMPRYEILPGLPAYGRMAVPFSAGRSTGGWGGHREGFVVRFYPAASEPWAGNFQPGFNGWKGVLEHPNAQHLIVVACGAGYVVDPEAREVVATLAGDVQHVVPLPERDVIVFCDGLGFEAINKNGLWWRSPRISWDGIRNIIVEGTTLRGEASGLDDNWWVPFSLDLMTGRCANGIYEQQTRQAIPIKPRRD